LNGDSKAIFDEIIKNGNRLTKIETLQVTNKEDIDEIKTDVKKCINLKTQVTFQWYILGACFIGIVSMFIRTIR